MADNGQRLGTDLVERVFRCVPVKNIAAGAVVEIDHIDGRDSALQRGLMIVFHGRGFIDEDTSVAEPLGNTPEEIDKRFGGISFALEVRCPRSDNVPKQKRFYPCKVAANSEPRGHFAASVAIGGVLPFRSHGLFTVKEPDPYRVATVLRAQQTRQLKHDSRRGTAVIRADEILKPLCVVMRA